MLGAGLLSQTDAVDSLDTLKYHRSMGRVEILISDLEKGHWFSIVYKLNLKRGYVVIIHE